jgi:riboflavin biosynthesis pyrimidine reductase
MSRRWLTLARLHPQPADTVDANDAYRWPERPWVRANMVASIDGAATLDGRVGTLTGPADQRLLLLLRATADVLVVGAGTLRAEGYGPLTVDPGLVPLRAAAGRSGAPRLVVLTRSLDVDLAGAAFSQALEPPLVLTTAGAPAGRVADARSVAEVVQLGEHHLPLGEVISHLHGRGYHRVLSEGGPTLLAGLVAAGLLDELCLAVAPVLTCGSGSRVTAGAALEAPHAMTLAHVAERDQFLFLRYTREGPAGATGAGPPEHR